MPASTALITDADSVITTGPGSATVAACIAAAGPINDYLGNVRLLKTKLQECRVLVTMLEAVTNSADTTNKAKLNDIKDSLD